MAARRALLLATLLVWPPDPAAGCASTVLQGGTLADSELVEPPVSTATSCACCGLCHQRRHCASLSFTAADGTCRLYRTVPDFRRLRVAAGSALFVRPGRSEHRQFCRLDTDCLEPDDRCYGRLCTTDVTVTCRDLSETYGAPASGLFYGSVDGATIRLYCREMNGTTGWTKIGYFTTGSTGWDRSNILERNVDNPHGAYSLLARADKLRLSGARQRYQIRIVGKRSTGGYRGFMGSLPTSQSLVIHSADEAAQSAENDFILEKDIGGYVSDSRSKGQFRLPWLPATGHSLLSLGKPQGDNQIFWTMIGTNNKPHLDGSDFYEYVTYYIRE
ncbi:uncharacterized protein LOC122382058 [Amphibalanus amphitrite]|uniref:uncharacterized protein LOC122382058 n=1 Tax=Amphibalanus amphitrite TaxID=1232801 RepID=UPI001C90A172|nr:uncharacterized protein LOC122382058 [Amphibalanus amphitrite]